MSQERISRRGFLKIAIGGTIGLAVGGCSQETPKTIPPTPETKPSPVAYEPTVSGEPIPKIEKIVLQNEATLINGELLLKGCRGMGGGEIPPLIPETGQQNKEPAFAGQISLFDLASKNWGVEIIPENGQFETIDALKLFVSTAAATGITEGTTVNLATAFPQFKELGIPLRFFCGQINRVQGGEYQLENAYPSGATLKNQAEVVVIGLFEEKSENGNTKRKILLAFNNWTYFDLESKKLVSREAPLYSLVAIPEENLNQVLELINNNEIYYQNGTIVFPGTNNHEEKVSYEWLVNVFDKKDEKLLGKILKEMGLEYLSNAEIPVIPFPPQELLEHLMNRLPPEELNKLPQDYSSIEWLKLIRKLYSHKDGIRGIFLPDSEGNLGEKPILTVGYDEKAKRWVWEKVEKKEEILAKIPEIEGLKKVLENKKIVYRAGSGNPYGLETEAWAGEYRENVFLNGKKTGGIVLNPNVAYRILNNELTRISKQNERWLIALPVDISKTSLEEKIDIYFTLTPDGVSRVNVDYKNILPIVNIIPNTHSLRILKHMSKNWWAYIEGEVTCIDPCIDKICAGKEIFYITVEGRFSGFSGNCNVNADFGNKISEAADHIEISLQAAKESRTIDENKILGIVERNTTKIPIFVAEK